MDEETTIIALPKIMRKIFKLIFVLSIILSSCSLFREIHPQNMVTKQDDYLIYYAVSNWGQRELMFYDPKSNTSTKILSDWIIDDFSVSVTNRLAFTTSQDGESEIYIVDYPYSENVPMDITPDNSKENTPLSWSPDGNALLIDSAQEDANKLLLWNGKKILDIYHYHEKVFDYEWGPNGELVFTDYYTFVFPYDGDPSEVFLWDGKDVVSVSQNPTGSDSFPSWSKDGKLAFQSTHNEECDIFVWDGISKNNGVPDKATFTNIAPDLTGCLSKPSWTNTGLLAFDGRGRWDLSSQIYVWNGRTTDNISNNPFYDNGGQTWRDDGYWAFSTFISDVTGQNVYIRNAKNHTILSTKGRYQPAWSQGGLLVFCVDDSSGWILSMWNGVKLIDIAQADFIKAEWLNGAYVYCSHG